MSEHKIVQAGEGDAEALAKLIARAFHPLAPSNWLIPDTHERHVLLPRHFRILVDDALSRGRVDTTPDLDGAAVWFHVPETGDPGSAGYDKALAAAVGSWLWRFKTFDRLLADHHLIGVRHDHLALLAVDPARQKRGIGDALLAAHHQRLDQADPPVAAYLEASDAQTRRIYLARGYTDHGDPIQLPGGPQMFPMIRPASVMTARPPLASAATAAP